MSEQTYTEEQIIAAINRTALKLDSHNYFLVMGVVMSAFNEIRISGDDILIRDTDLPLRIKNALWNNLDYLSQYEPSLKNKTSSKLTLSDVAILDHKNLLRVRNMGRTSLKVLLNYLKEKGFKINT